MNLFDGTDLLETTSTEIKNRILNPGQMLRAIDTGALYYGDKDGKPTAFVGASTSSSGGVAKPDVGGPLEAMYRENAPLAPPEGFGWTPPILPVRKNGKWKGHVPALSLFPVVSGASYYVDALNGVDTNAGTSAAPFKTATKALGMADVGAVYIAPSPLTSLNDGIWGNPTVITTSPQVIVRPWPIRSGRPLIAAAWSHFQDSWTVNATYGRCYGGARTGVIGVWEKDPVFGYVKLESVASIASANTRPGTYYYDNTTLTVHTLRSAVPDRNVIVCIGSNAVTWPSNVNLYVQGIDVIGGISALSVPDSSANFVFVDCTFGVANSSNSVSTNTSGTVILENCRVHSAVFDGFNYHSSATNGAGKIIEINCESYNVGINGGSNQGSTVHDGCSILRIGGRYGGSDNQSIADVNVGTKSWNVGCTILPSRNGSTNNVSIYLNESQGWFHDCDFGENRYSLVLAGDNARAYLDSSFPSVQAVTGAGVIGTYSQTYA